MSQIVWFTMEWDWHSRTTVDEKIWYRNSMIPTVWSVAIVDYLIKQADWVNYWHTAIVMWYDEETWTIILKDANRDWDWQIHTYQRNIKRSFY
mgnify:FL=1